MKISLFFLFVFSVTPAIAVNNPETWKCPEAINSVKQVSALSGQIVQLNSCQNRIKLLEDAISLSVKTGHNYWGHLFCSALKKTDILSKDILLDCSKAELFLGRDAAKVFLSRFLDLQKQSRSAFIKAADTAARAFRFRVSQWVMQRYLKKHPKDRDAACLLCKYCLKAGNFDKAEQNAEKWLHLTPVPGLDKDAGRVLGLFDEYKAYDQILKLVGVLPSKLRGDFTVLRYVTAAALKMKKKSVAKRAVLRFLDAHKDRDSVARVLGLLVKLKMSDLALFVTGRLGRKLPSRLYLLKAKILLNKNRHVQAKRDLLKYVKQSKDKARAFINAITELQDRDLNKDIIAMGRMVYPGMVHTDTAAMKLGASYFRIGQKQAEWELYERHAKKFGGSSFMMQVASVYFDRSNLDSAERAYKTALLLTKAPLDKAKVLLGLVDLSLRKAPRFRKEAVVYIRQYINLRQYTAKQLDKLLLQVKKIKAPKSLMLRLLKARSLVKPRSRKYDLKLLGLMLKTGDRKGAVRVMHKLVKDAEKDPKFAMQLLEVVRKGHGVGMLDLLREMGKNGSGYPPLVQGLIGMRFLSAGNLYKARSFLKVFFESRPGTGPGMNAKWRIKLGESLEKSGVLDLAATAFKGVLKYGSDKDLIRKAAKGLLEICVFGNQDCRETEDAYLKVWGRNIKSFVAIGNIYRDNTMPKKAMEWYEKAYDMAKNKQKAKVLVKMMSIAGSMGKTGSMDGYVGEMVKTCKGKAVCIRPVIRAFAKAGMYKRAVKILAGAGLLSPSKMPELCGFYLHAGKPDAAYQCYLRSGLHSGKKPDRSLVSKVIANAYELMSSGRPGLGIKLLGRFVANGVKSKFLSGIKNNMECRFGMFKSAADDAMQVIRRAESVKDTNMAVEIAVCLLENGKDVPAGRILSATIKKYPDNSKAAYYMAGLLYDRNNIKKAHEILSHLNGKGSRWVFNAMQTAVSHGDRQWAVGFGRKAVKALCDKGHVFTKNDMGLVQTVVDYGEADFVAGVLDKAVVKKPSDTGFLDSAGRVYADILAMPKKAVNAFNAAIKAGGPKVIYREMARSMLVLGQRDQAIAALVKYIDDAQGAGSDSRHARFAAVMNRDIPDATPDEVSVLLKAVGKTEELTAGAYLVLASAYLRVGNVDKGYIELRKALRPSNALIPRLPRLSDWLKRVLYREITAGRGSKLLAFLDQLPWSVALGYLKIRLLCVLGDHDAVVSEGDKLAGMQESIGLFGRLETASIMLNCGDADAAFDMAWKAIRLKDINMRVFANAITIILKAGRLSGHKVDVDDIVSLMQKRTENRAAMYFTLASAFSKAGLHEDAAQYLEKRLQYPFTERRQVEASGRVSAGMNLLRQAWEADDQRLVNKAVSIMQKPGADTLRVLKGLQEFYEKKMFYKQARKIADQRLQILPGQGMLMLKKFTYDALDGDSDAVKEDMNRLLAMKPSERFVAAAILNVVNAGNLPMAMDLLGLAKKAGYKGRHIRAVRINTLIAMGMTAKAREFLSDLGNLKDLVLSMVAQDPRYSIHGLESDVTSGVLSPVTVCRLAINGCDSQGIERCTAKLGNMGSDGVKQVKDLMFRAMQVQCEPAIQGLFKLLKRPGMSKYDRFVFAIGLSDLPVDVIKYLPVDLRKQIGDFLNKQVAFFLNLEPENVWKHSVLAVTKGFSGNWVSGMAYFDKALKWFKGSGMIMNNAAYFMSLLSIRPDDSLKLARTARILDPSQDAYYAETQAWAMYKAGQKKDALQAEQQAVRYMSAADGEGISEGFYHLGMINLDLGHRSQALRAFRISQYLYPASVYGRRSFKMIQRLLKKR